jgi:predicted nucleic acid-binding protein
MQIIVNATFLINIIKTDPRVLRELNLITTTMVAFEVENELGVNVADFKVGVVKPEASAPNMPKKGYLSEVDIGLIKHSFKNKSCLITDDRKLRGVAKANRLCTLTTPQFIALLARSGRFSKEKSLRLLNELKKTYIRKKDIEKTINKIRGW